MKVVIQEEEFGCGIASVANIVGLSYQEVKQKANEIGIFAEDKQLYSDTEYISRLLAEYNIETSKKERAFTSWKHLPDLALLAVKYHKVENIPFWHWVVSKRIDGKIALLDSADTTNKNSHMDLLATKPEWYIELIDRRDE